MIRANHSITGLRLVIGKNAPENRNSGIIPRRKTRENALSSFIAALSAKTGVANASPMSSWTKKASSTPHHDANTPNRDITARKTALTVATRNST